MDYAEKYYTINGNKILASFKLLGVSLPRVKFKDGTEAPDEVLKFILVSYGRFLHKLDVQIDPDADAAADSLSYSSFYDALEFFCERINCTIYPCFIPMLCRFGGANQIKKMISKWNEWGEWSLFGIKGKKAKEVFNRYIILSETHEAILFCEKHRLLSNYANLRNTSVDQIYEKKLYNFDLDQYGIRIFDLGITKIEVKLTPNGTFSLCNVSTGETVKQIPKKGVNPDLFKHIENQVLDMKQTIKEVSKIKINQLFHDYIEGALFTTEKWIDNYLKNPFLSKIASTLIWVQDRNTFILNESRLIYLDGTEYILNDNPIMLAHPMDMDWKEIVAWQKYFISHNLKQPFTQIWEPVYEQRDVTADRYKGCKINSNILKNQKKRGIYCEWYDIGRTSKHILEISGFSCNAISTSEVGWLEIVNLIPEKWDRHANCVISYLDCITIYDRIKIDDISIAKYLQLFTLRQITDFIQIAAENNCTNVMSLLLEYKNGNCAGFDPMEEFSLDF